MIEAKATTNGHLAPTWRAAAKTAASVVVQHARVRETIQRLAVLEDRERIALELNDGAIQRLFAVGMSLQSTAVQVNDSRLVERLDENVSQIDQVIRDLRNCIFGLGPAIFHVRQVDEALRL